MGEVNKKHQVHVASYVILIKDQQVLMMRRANTGYCDGAYGLPAGHVEADENPQEAAIREAKEEIGVEVIDPQFAQVLYSNNIYVCFFFTATKWNGEIKNAEPEKCDELKWFSLEALPDNMPPEVKVGLENFLKKEYYSIQYD